MASTKLREFLESSTIHGLVHISTAKSKTAKAIWVTIVVACFAIAVYMITNSYKEWQESPVSTTITTHPITELEFPTVTVCPPRGSNTALNHLLEKVKDVNFSEEERRELLDISNEVFIEMPNKKSAKQIRELLSRENRRSIANGQAGMPEMDGEGKITIKSYELEGNFQTPGFRDAQYKGDFYSRHQSLHYVLNFPGNVDGVLVISVETDGNWSFASPGIRLKLFNEKLTMPFAEEFCVNQGGHLASVGSQEKQEEVEKLARSNIVWLGGRREAGGEKVMQWVDGQTWGYENWDKDQPDYCAGCHCLTTGEDRPGRWNVNHCTWHLPFICDLSSPKMSGNHILVVGKTSVVNSTVHFWWENTPDRFDQNMVGFHINWHIENGTNNGVRQFESTALSGNISTPGLGSLPPPNYNKERHEYTAVIELPHNITDVIGDGALVVDVDIVPDNQRDGEVELLTGEPKLEFYKIYMTWSAAEKFCVSKGGHLASVASPFHWHRLQSFMALNDIKDPIWLGATDEGREGEWTWTDGSKWSEEHWRSPDQPSNHSGENCINLVKNRWFDDPCFWQSFTICSVPTKTVLTSDTHLVFTSENISIPAIQFRWAQQPISQEEEDENDEQAGLEGDLRRNRIGGFKLGWQLLGSTKVTSNTSKSGWKMNSFHRSHEKDLNILTIGNLVRESKIHKVERREIWKTILKYRWNIDILTNSPCLNETQVAEVIYKTGQDLNLKYDWNLWIPEEDLAFVTELYSALQYCPGNLVESAKLSVLFESLLTNHSLNTVVAATMENIQPRAGDNIKDFTAINMWYERLDERYSFSLGSTILPLLTSDNFTTLANLDPPFLRRQKNNISALFGRT